MYSKLVLVFTAQLLPISVCFASLPLDIAGKYQQEGNCVCRQSSTVTDCEKQPLAIHALGNYSIGGIHEYGETSEQVTDLKTGKKKYVDTWLYPYDSSSGDLRVRQGDTLIYTIAENAVGTGYDIAIHNKTLSQKDLVLKLQIPMNQSGGNVDGPANIQTIIDSTGLTHGHTVLRSDKGQSMGPPAPANPGIISNSAVFQINKKDKDTLVLMQMYDHKALRTNPPAIDVINFSLLFCNLKRVN